MTLPEPRPRAPRWRVVLVTVLALGFVAFLTLGSVPVDPFARQAPFYCLIGCQAEGLRDLLSNMLLFLPLGWALRHWFRPSRAIGLCLILTVTIEALQVSVITGRDASLRDILGNTLGGALGAWLFDHWRGLLWPDRARGMRLGMVAAVGWTVVLAGSGLANHLDPTDPPWYGHWTPELGQYDRYPGRLVTVDLDGWSPPIGPMREPAPLREAMRRDSFLLTLRVEPGGLPRRAAPIFAVTDQLMREQFFVAQKRRALWLHLRNTAERWNLRGLLVRIPLLPAITPGDTMTIEAGVSDRQVILRAISGARVAEIRVPQTVGLGWTSMLPFSFPLSTEWLLVNPLWLAGLILPAGYWFGRAVPGTGLALTAVALAAGLALVPVVAGAAPTTSPEWIGAAVGALLGWSSGAWSRRRSRSTRSRES